LQGIPLKIFKVDAVTLKGLLDRITFNNREDSHKPELPYVK